MARERGLSWGGGHQWPPTGAPHYHHVHHPHHPPRHDPSSLTTPGVRDAGSQYEYDSVNAVSFGFVATAVLVSMFLVMALFEKFLRPSPSLSPSGSARRREDLEARSLAGKLGHPSPKMTLYDDGVSVLMPGDDLPSYIAHPAPVPCSRENILWPYHRPDAPS
ncbi:uncharacterized protein LOC115739654 [Rhodamnia argentea]|uniref:Uncharacterized protein LOC115739654 n=1 Tax=Rhodamnia argentea TaxID=178133 RepID=A0A8B8P1M0_9MYRT|nr:uncharacterized protein LOC115739654 [Rhodamnia argentea]